MNKIIFVALIAATLSVRVLEDIDYAAFNKEELAAHNKYRALHKDTPALVLNETMRAQAQAWADKLCESNPKGAAAWTNFGHNPKPAVSAGVRNLFLIIFRKTLLDNGVHHQEEQVPYGIMKKNYMFIQLELLLIIIGQILGKIKIIKIF